MALGAVAKLVTLQEKIELHTLTLIQAQLPLNEMFSPGTATMNF